MKYRIKEQPTGYRSVNGGPLEAWPAAGELVDLTSTQAADMIRAGHVEEVPADKPAKKAGDPRVETRPAPTSKVETRVTPKAKQAD